MIDMTKLITAEMKAETAAKDALKAIETAITNHINTTAQADGWDDKTSCVTRAGYPNEWQAKGIAFGQWVDTCWSLVIKAQADIEAGTRTIPTPEEAVLEMPEMVWPTEVV